MHQQPVSGLEATYFVITVGLSLLFLMLAFLTFKTARAQSNHEKVWKGLSAACLLPAGLFLALTLLELAFRIAMPGGYFSTKPRAGSAAEANVEEVDGQAYWWYPNARDFDAGGYRGGFREPTDHALKVVVLGDSVTFGVGVPLVESFPYLLEQRLRKECGEVTFYNLAVPGYGAVQERISLERNGLGVKPDLVFVGALSNDIEQFTVIGSTAYDVRMKEHNGVPVFSMLPLPDGLNRFLVSNSVFYQFLTLAGVKTFDEVSGRKGGQVELAIDEYERMLQGCRKVGATMVIALFPMLDRKLALPEDENAAHVYGRLREWAKANGVTIIEMRPELSKHPLEEIRIDTCCHLSPYGHRAAADALARRLKEAGGLPCRSPK